MAPCKLYFYILFNIFENTKTLTLYPLRCAKAAFSGFFLPENDQRVAFYCFLREIRHNWNPAFNIVLGKAYLCHSLYLIMKIWVFIHCDNNGSASSFDNLYDCTFNERSPKNCQTFWNFLVYKLSEKVFRRCSAKYMLLKVSQNAQENFCYFLTMLQAWGLQLY